MDSRGVHSPETHAMWIVLIAAALLQGCQGDEDLYGGCLPPSVPPDLIVERGRSNGAVRLTYSCDAACALHGPREQECVNHDWFPSEEPECDCHHQQAPAYPTQHRDQGHDGCPDETAPSSHGLQVHVETSENGDKWLSYECTAPCRLIGNNHVRTCENNKWLPEEEPVCQCDPT
eukprot:scpid93094/ scgid19747/ 